LSGASILYEFYSTILALLFDKSNSMKNILLAICIVLFYSSCHKNKNETVAPKGPWTLFSQVDNGLSYITCLRDTLVLGCNITTVDYTMPYFFTGAVAPTSTGFYGHGVPFENGMILLAAYEDGLFTTTFNESIYYSGDLCKSWVKKDNGLSSSADIEDIVGGNNGLYACGSGIFFSDNNGDSWSDISIPDMFRAYHIVSVENTLIACIETKSSSVAILYKSEDNGTTWTPLNPLGIPTSSVSKFAVIDNVLYASLTDGTNSYLYISSDKGANWIKSKGLDILGDNTFRAFESHNGVAYVGTYHGVFKSVDNGQNWTSVGCDNVISMVINDNILYAATLSNSVWKASLTSL